LRPAPHEEERSRYLDDLSARGLTPSRSGHDVTFTLNQVDVYVATTPDLRGYLDHQLESFAPDVVLVCTNDPTQVLLRAALRWKNRRVVYLARSTPALPFGPDAVFASDVKTQRMRETAVVVGVSEYVANYVRRHARIDAVHVPLSLLERTNWPNLASFDNEYVSMVNPCAYKGISIFLALADAMPHVRFAAVPTWGTNAHDHADLARRSHICVLPPVDDINDLLRRTRVLLVPSLWAEARSRIVPEAMLAGVPVLASDVGGVREAKLGVPYLLPVTPIAAYHLQLDDQMVPVAEVPPQDISPWRHALERMVTSRAAYEEVSRASWEAALTYPASVDVGPLKALLRRVAKSRESFGEPR
jgi:glycosyltransferase involved in cell wall biosynthesis